MSDTHVDKDETTRVNYNEIVKAASIGLITTATIPVFGPIIAVHQLMKVLQKPKLTPTENLIEIFRAGKEQGLAELEIEMDKSIAVEITPSVFSDFGGVSVNTEFERKNRLILKVKYK